MRNFQRPGRSPVQATQAMAATSSPQASLAAIDVMRRGGNAVDAAVAAAAVLCVTEPTMTGIGGDCFALIGKPDGSVIGINGSGRAPAAADAAWLDRAGLAAMPEDGAITVTVPGAVDAWDRLLKAHGTMGLGDVLEPAITLAEQGVLVLPRVAEDWEPAAPVLERSDGGAQHYLKDGRAPRAGEVMRYPALAATMRTIGRQGRDAFYQGEIAQDIVATLASEGSVMTLKDLERTEADWVEPVATTFQGSDVLEIPPSGQGITALIALNILAEFDIGSFAAEGVERRHLSIEAMRLAWNLRDRYVGDPQFTRVPVEEMLSVDTARRLARQVSPDRAMSMEAATQPLPHSDTVYLTVVDKNRLAVSFINSVFSTFGSGIVTRRTGITLQNRGACFSTVRGHPNCIGPGKRPLHTIIPALLRRNGKVVMTFGVMGGSYQPMGHLEVVVNRLVHGMDVQATLDFPRLMPLMGMVDTEETVPQKVLAGLHAKGHRLVASGSPLGSGQIIEIAHEGGVLSGASDFRRDGMALGY